MKSPRLSEYQRVKSVLRRAAIERNAKTALILGVAASGAFFGLPGLALTAAGTTLAVSLAKYRQDRN